MKINFKSHQITDREVEFGLDNQARLFNIMKREFINYITYSRFNSPYTNYITAQLENFCTEYGIDIEYEKDRVAFFTALMENMTWVEN